MTRGRWAALFVAGVALAGAGALGAVAWIASTHSDRVLGAVGRGLGRDVTAKHLGVSVLGGLGVELTDVAIADDPAFDAKAPFLTAERFALRVRVLPLLHRRIVVDRVVVEQPVVTLVRDRAGRMNADSLGRGPNEHAPEPEHGGPPGGERPAIQLASVRLRNGTVHYRDQSSGQSFTLDDVAIDAREPRFDGPIPVSLRMRLAGSDLRLDGVESEGVLEMGGEQPAYHGTMHGGPGALGTLPLERVEAEVRVSPPVLTLERATVALLGGTIQGKGRLASGGEGAGLAADVEATGLDLAALPARPDKPHPAGTLALHGSCTGPPPGTPGFNRALTGSGGFTVADGRVQNVPLGRTVRDLLAPVLGADTAARLRERYPDLFGGDDLRFTKLSGSGRLAGGRIATDDLVLAGASYEATGTGSLGLDGTIDLALRLAASPALTDDLLGRSKARPFLVGTDGRLTVPLRVRGPLAKPAVTPDPEFTSTVARSLLGGTPLGEAAGDLLNRLFGGKRTKR